MTVVETVLTEKNGKMEVPVAVKKKDNRKLSINI